MSCQYLQLGLGIVLFTLSACNISVPDGVKTPTLEKQNSTSPTPRAVPTSLPTPTPTPTEQPTIVIVTPSATHTPRPPTATTVPSVTSAFIEYVVQENDSMYYVIQLPQHGYNYEPNVAATVVALNSNIFNADFLPVGETILIPRPTPIATPAGASATQAILATIGIDNTSGAPLPSGAEVGCYEVAEGDSLVGIAISYDTTLEVLSLLNQQINWFGCAFTEPSGGPDCNPNIQIGQCIHVPRPTPLPTKRPTPTGDETATPTATHMAPRLLYPVDGAHVAPGNLLLQWVGVSGMTETDEYLIELIDQTSNNSLQQVSKSNAFWVSKEFVPQDGRIHIMQWRVSIARHNEQRVYFYVGAPGIWRTFEWMSP